MKRKEKRKSQENNENKEDRQGRKREMAGGRTKLALTILCTSNRSSERKVEKDYRLGNCSSDLSSPKINGCARSLID